MPPWAVAAWEQQAGRPWRHEGPGFVLAHRDGRIVVLTGSELRGRGLDIVPTGAGDSLGMREAPAPDGWFDLVEPAGGGPVAGTAGDLTPRGDCALSAAAGCRVDAVAVVAYRAGASRTYYLAGDFANSAAVPHWTRLRWAPQLYRALPGWWLPPRSRSSGAGTCRCSPRSWTGPRAAERALGRRPRGALARRPGQCAYLSIMHTSSGTIALAFSGGLDTSYCVPRLAEQGWAVHTVYVNTGGATPEERAAIRRQADAVGRCGAPRGGRPRSWCSIASSAS